MEFRNPRLGTPHTKWASIRGTRKSDGVPRRWRDWLGFEELKMVKFYYSSSFSRLSQLIFIPHVDKIRL